MKLKYIIVSYKKPTGDASANFKRIEKAAKKS